MAGCTSAAVEAGLSKATVFNYFPRKDDLIFAGPAAHVGDPGDIVRRRAAGESVVQALRRVYLSELAERQPQTGMSPEAAGVIRLIVDTLFTAEPLPRDART